MQLSTMMKQFVPLGKAVGVAVESEQEVEKRGDRCRGRQRETRGKRMVRRRRRERGERSELNFI